MNRTMLFAAIATSILVIAGILLYRVNTAGPDPRVQPSAGGTAAVATSATEYYTCPMHPSVRSDHPGACPICGMTLVKRSERIGAADTGASALGRVALSPSQQVLANVSVIFVKRARLRKQISAVGSIEEAEPSLGHITMRFPGRIELLHVTFTGEHISRGNAVAEVYSPEAVSAQKEYLLALESADATKDAYPDIAEGSAALLSQSKQKLLRWGITEEQIERLSASRQVLDTLTIYSPVTGTVVKKYAQVQEYLSAGAALFDVADLSSVWLMAEIHESDLPWVRTGSAAEAVADAVQDTRFSGTVTFIDPVIDPGSRTARARIALANRNGALKLGMYLRVNLFADLSSELVVPASALLTTGDRAIVWVRKEAGVFEPRSVVVGARSGDQVQILHGLDQGESVVVSGGYLLDSESQLRSTSEAPPSASKRAGE